MSQKQLRVIYPSTRVPSQPVTSYKSNGCTTTCIKNVSTGQTNCTTVCKDRSLEGVDIFYIIALIILIILVVIILIIVSVGFYRVDSYEDRFDNLDESTSQIGQIATDANDSLLLLSSYVCNLGTEVAPTGDTGLTGAVNEIIDAFAQPAQDACCIFCNRRPDICKQLSNFEEIAFLCEITPVVNGASTIT